MNIKEILSVVDHTQLSPAATWTDIQHLCEQALRFSTASVCIAPSFVEQAKAFLGDRMRVCTVIGFPNGYNTLKVKCFEAEQALAAGADEIDMVIHIGRLKEKKYQDVLEEIRAVKSVCGDHILKVIVETCLLTEAEKIKMCELVSQGGADFIKTSTGFSTGGATVQDIRLFAAHVAPSVQIKAAGGIRTLADAEAMIAAGATRLGTSRIVAIAEKEEENHVSDTAY